MHNVVCARPAAEAASGSTEPQTLDVLLLFAGIVHADTAIADTIIPDLMKLAMFICWILCPLLRN